MNSKFYKKLIFSKITKHEKNNFFVRQEDFVMERGENDWVATIEILKKIQKHTLDKKSIPEYLIRFQITCLNLLKKSKKKSFHTNI